jgi:hypothetical protein
MDEIHVFFQKPGKSKKSKGRLENRNKRFFGFPEGLFIRLVKQNRKRTMYTSTKRKGKSSRNTILIYKDPLINQLLLFVILTGNR